jgi:hydrogenase nickel incorporation protein HypB
VQACKQAALRVNPRIEILIVSARTGEGIGDFINWIADRAATPA